MSKKLLFKDENDKIIYESELTELPLRDEYIISKSNILFSDPEPCIIHRTYIIKKFYIELDKFLNNFNAEDSIFELEWDKIPIGIKKPIDLKKKPTQIVVLNKKGFTQSRGIKCKKKMLEKYEK